MTTAKRYRFTISYHGGDYCGWQVQPNVVTVQGEIEKRLSQLAQTPIEIIGCGRTDTGVHASDYVFHTDIATSVETDDLRYKLNSMLPSTIAIHDVEECDPLFHARYDAISRSYTYFIHFEKDPFRDGLSYQCPYGRQIDTDQLKEFTELLLRYEDFATFCKAHSDVKHTRCRIDSAAWIIDDYPRSIRFEITANRFLRGMIRLIVGASINLSRGKLELSDIKNALEQQTLLPLAWSAPAEGLYLSAVRY